ncbi:hypothetical protein J4219_07500 [Candidatus Woesearchaeota archaeon]|nr:hypothetical protein [Candidatus Woesearchaeota archaeon]
MTNSTDTKLYTDDLTEAQITAIELQLRPQKTSASGFLNQSERLKDVIEADARTLNDLNITHKQVSDRLESLIGQALRNATLGRRTDGIPPYKTLKDGILIDKIFKVSGGSWMGYQNCPLPNNQGNCPEQGSYDFKILNETSVEEIQFPQLMSHLIRDHQFFEGHTQYRLDPTDAVRILGLKTGIDYTPLKESEECWFEGSYTNSLDNKIGRDIIYAERYVYLGLGVKFYFQGNKGVTVSREPVRFTEPLSVHGVKLDLCQGKIPAGKLMFKKEKREYISGDKSQFNGSRAAETTKQNSFEGKE